MKLEIDQGWLNDGQIRFRLDKSRFPGGEVEGLGIMKNLSRKEI